MDKHPYLSAAVFLAALGLICWTVVTGYQASVEKARLTTEAKEFKAHEGNKFKFGLTHERNEPVTGHQ